MSRQWWSDDEQLLAALDDVLWTGSAVPRDFVEAGKAIYTWRSIDAELAALIYDSAAVGEPQPALTRAKPAPLRAMTFTSAALTIELEVMQDALLGQVVPPQSGEVGVVDEHGEHTAEEIDEVGCFAIRPIPSSPFRLHCRTADGSSVVTSWIAV